MSRTIDDDSETGADSVTGAKTGGESGLVCRKCRGAVDAMARKCPHCGYSAHAKSASAFGTNFMAGLCAVGKWSCYVTIVGIPLGLVFRRYQRKYAAKDDRTIGVEPSM